MRAFISLALLAATLSVRAADETPTEQEAKAFAAQLEEKIGAGDAAFFSDRFDMDALLDIALYDQDGKAAELRGFREGVKQSKDVLAKSLAQGSYKFLRCHVPKVGGMRALFRFLSDAGVNYHDLVLRKDGGAVKVVDMDVFVTGELMSQTARRSYLNAFGKKPGVVDKLLGNENAFVKNAEKIGKMGEAVRNGQPKEALDIYESLPDECKKEKTNMLVRITATSQVEGADSQKAIEEYQAQFPNDPSIDLVTIDLYAGRKEYGKAIECVRRLDKTVGGDPYLHHLEGNIHLLMGEKKEAKALAAKAMEEEPTLEQPYETLINLSLAEKDFGATVDVLTKMEKNLKVQLPDLTQIEDYKEFVQSDAYKKWMESRKK